MFHEEQKRNHLCMVKEDGKRSLWKISNNFVLIVPITPAKADFGKRLPLLLKLCESV